MSLGEQGNIMKRLAIIAFSFLLLFLGSCAQATTPDVVASPSPYASQTLDIGLSTTPTITSTQVSIPVPTQPGERIYIDPQGWYSFHYPVDWQPAEHPSLYRGEDGFFETGYLPEMMFMRNNLNVCQWLVNISTKDTYSILLIELNQVYACQLTSLPGVTPAVSLVILQNRSADLPHQFLYIKADAAHFEHIANSFTWLRPVDDRAKPDFQSALPRPEDTAFWKDTSSLPPNFSLTEHQLPSEVQGANPGETTFLDFVPPEILPVWSRSSEPYSPNSLEKVNRKIASYGYELRTGAESYLYNLYQGGSLALENVILPDVYLLHTPDTEKLVFLARTHSELPIKMSNIVTYLIQDDTISLWEKGPPNPIDPFYPPIWANGQLLILGMGQSTNVQVRNEHRDILFAFQTYFGSRIPIERFQAWGNHWILEVSDFVAQDGEILNEQFGFEEVFSWYLIDEKPFYFFRKGPRVGISYDDQFLDVNYEEIIHGYCCGLGLNNPMLFENTVRFFGKRDGIWYYVIVEVK
jgi:hypothetical protein